MTDFILIDLNSQADAVVQHTNQWPRERILAWLEQYGSVTARPEHGVDFYVFCSYLGLYTGFRLTAEGTFIIFRYRTTYFPRKSWH